MLVRNGGSIDIELMLVWAAAAEHRGQRADADRLLDMAVKEENNLKGIRSDV